jgi:hypothetical protein
MVDLVRPAGSQQRPDHLGQRVVVVRRGQVESGMEGALGAEGEHHQRILRLEAEDDGYGREQVLWAAGGECRGHVTTFSS